ADDPTAGLSRQTWRGLSGGPPLATVGRFNPDTDPNHALLEKTKQDLETKGLVPPGMTLGQFQDWYRAGLGARVDTLSHQLSEQRTRFLRVASTRENDRRPEAGAPN